MFRFNFSLCATGTKLANSKDQLMFYNDSFLIEKRGITPTEHILKKGNVRYHGKICICNHGGVV